MPNWNQVHQEIVRAQLQAAVAGDTIRRGYLDELFRAYPNNP